MKDSDIDIDVITELIKKSCIDKALVFKEILNHSLLDDGDIEVKITFVADSGWTNVRIYKEDYFDKLKKKTRKNNLIALLDD